MKLEHWKLIRKLSVIYIAVIAVFIIFDIAVLSIVDYGNKPADFVGCYAYDAMVVGFECTGFIGSKPVSLALNLPLFHLYMPFFIIYNPIFILVVIAMWFFPVMFVLSISKLKRKST
ncbi:hypothetical protein [Paraglaciecola sp. 20A4]|uniref:hypothetical protein n=1 Tax=Paraglaciecola sp. 20A4 TaxID=2687288 RepID=UPI00140A4E86|nr:hypothetical protein [Paraglaciecola sp. 20A4]